MPPNELPPLPIQKAHVHHLRNVLDRLANGLLPPSAVVNVSVHLQTDPDAYECLKGTATEISYPHSQFPFKKAQVQSGSTTLVFYGRMTPEDRRSALEQELADNYAGSPASPAPTPKGHDHQS